MINLATPVRSTKERGGFQPHWITIFHYECPDCKKNVRVRANAFRGTTPVPGVGAITCPHCKGVKQ